MSAVLHVTLDSRGQFVRGGITPLRLVSPGLPQRDPDDTAVSYVNALSHKILAGTGQYGSPRRAASRSH